MKIEGPKWYQVFRIVLLDIVLVCAAVFLVVNNHMFWAFFLLLFISDGSDFGFNITWNNNNDKEDKEDDR